VDDLEALHAELEAELGILFNRLLEYNDDFEVLQKLECEEGGGFTDAELAELRPLMGLYGGEIEVRLPPGAANAEYVGLRQMYWGRRRSESLYGTVEHAVADRAYATASCWTGSCPTRTGSSKDKGAARLPLVLKLPRDSWWRRGHTPGEEPKKL
jgi:hypothetical protein